MGKKKRSVGRIEEGLQEKKAENREGRGESNKEGRENRREEEADKEKMRRRRIKYGGKMKENE